MGRIDSFKIGIAVALAFICLSIPRTAAQSTSQFANTPQGSTAKFPVLAATDNLIESDIQPKAFQLYQRAVRELHEGHAVIAEQDAMRALQSDKTFADAAALAATSALAQQQFDRARQEATQAVEINPADEKAWVILATAQNYLDHFSEAIAALRHVRPQDQGTWQVAYEWARAEAGLQNLPLCVEWTNRAALSAPPSFGPLHLLRASALLALGQTLRAGDELEIYLQLPSVNPSKRDLLTHELHRLRQLQQKDPLSSPAFGN